MRTVVVLIMSCLLVAALGSNGLAGELFEEKPQAGLDTSPKAQLWREQLRDDGPVAPKQVRRSDDLDALKGYEDLEAEVDREIGADHDVANVGE